MTARIRKKRILQGLVSAGVRRLPKDMVGQKWIPSEARILRGIRRRYGFLRVSCQYVGDAWIVRAT